MDIEYNAGHSHTVDDVWFGSCWTMWFGNDYFKIIDKDAVMAFEDSYACTELAGGLVKITLYEDLWAYELEQNRAIQWAFRHHASVDQAAHLFELQIQPESDPSMEIWTTTGGGRRLMYHANQEGHLTEKSRAAESRMIEVRPNQKRIWSITKAIGNRFGKGRGIHKR